MKIKSITIYNEGIGKEIRINDTVKVRTMNGGYVTGKVRSYQVDGRELDALFLDINGERRLIYGKSIRAIL